MGRIVKMYEDFNSDESHDFYDKDQIYIDLKSSSEEILKVIGFEKETEWFDLLNDLAIAKTEEEFHVVMGKIEDFLREYKES